MPSIKNYKYPRPVWAKALGDSLLGIGTVGNLAAYAADYPGLGLIIQVVGVISYAFSTFYRSYDQELTRLETREVTVEQTTTIEQTTTVSDTKASPELPKP